MAKSPAIPYLVYVKDASGKFGTPVPLADLLAAGNTIVSFTSVGNTAVLKYTNAAGVEQTAEINLVKTNTLTFDPTAKTLTSEVNGVASAAIDVSALVADINVASVEWNQGTFILKLTETSPDGGVTPGQVHEINLESLIPVATDMSLTGNGTQASKLTLVGDEAAPGNNQYYGTDGTGVKGYHPLVADDLQIATEAITAAIVEDIPLEGYGDANKMLWAPAVWLKVIGPDGQPLVSGGKTVLVPGYLAD